MDVKYILHSERSDHSSFFIIKLKGQPLFRETARIRFLELEWITHLVRLRQKGKRQHKFHNQRSYQDR